MEKISLDDLMKKEEVFRAIKEERNILYVIKKEKAK
jgi:hypothetical protein